LATNLALYLLIDPSNFNFLLKIHLLPIGLLLESKFANFQVWLLRMDSISLFIISFYICASEVGLASLYVWASLSSIYALKFGPKDLEILYLVFLLGSASALTSFLKVFRVFFSQKSWLLLVCTERRLQRTWHFWIR